MMKGINDELILAARLLLARAKKRRRSELAVIINNWKPLPPHTGCHRSGVVEMGRQVLTSGMPAQGLRISGDPRANARP
jgi:hypothetical protein